MVPAAHATEPQQPAVQDASPAAMPTPDKDMSKESDQKTDNSPIGIWLLEDIQDSGVIDRVRTELDIQADGRISGSGGCNRFSTQGKLEGNRLSIDPAASTRMACPPAVMEQEARFLKMLEDVRGWRVDTQTQKLFLLDDADATLLTFSATTPAQ